MATDKQWIKHYENELTSSGKTYKAWSEKFETDLLERYWEGDQYEDQRDSTHQKSYVINMFWPTIEGKLANLFFQRPQVNVEGRPSRKDDPASLVDARSQLLEDTINTLLDDENLHFVEETSDPLREHFFRFGVVEVGYTAKFSDNPNARRPVTISENGVERQLVNSKGEVVRQADFYVTNQQMFVKHVPASTFRVPTASHKVLERNDWVAYYEWFTPEQLKADKSLNQKAVRALRPTSKLKDRVEPFQKNDETMASAGMVKIWKLWDRQRQKRVMFAEGHEDFLKEDTFKFFPFAVIKGPNRLQSFYPVPPAFNWIHPQNEINDIRDKQRVYRQRAEPRFGRLDSVDEEEWRKIEDGGPYSCAVLPSQDSIWQIPIGDDSFRLERAAPQTKMDFQEIAAFSGDDTAIANTETATQGTILQMRSRVRESSERERVAKWLVKVLKLMIFTAIEKMPLPLVVKTNVDVDGMREALQKANAGDVEAANEIMAQATAAAQIAETWREVKAMDLADFKFDIKIQVESLSPISTEQDLRNLLSAIAIISQNPIFMFSDFLLKKLLTQMGIRGNKEFVEIKKAIQAVMQMQAAAAQEQQGGGGQGAPGQVAPGSIPNQDQIMEQLVSQVGGGVIQ